MSDGEIFERWISVMRFKATEYEHKARANGEQVTAPSLDELCWEMRAYMTGRGIEPPMSAQGRAE